MPYCRPKFMVQLIPRAYGSYFADKEIIFSFVKLEGSFSILKNTSIEPHQKLPESSLHLLTINPRTAAIFCLVYA
jgi:hypothetical protein